MESVLLRLWVPAEGQDPELRGVARHVASGEEVVFRSAGELHAWLQGCLARAADSARVIDDQRAPDDEAGSLRGSPP